jgi:hypothetical protein
MGSKHVNVTLPTLEADLFQLTDSATIEATHAPHTGITSLYVKPHPATENDPTLQIEVSFTWLLRNLDGCCSDSDDADFKALVHVGDVESSDAIA